eukprot:m.160769 g.160769  ORF g.160769 m.160769 type:complete len:623 (+) comp15173_c0_seq6:41-1909(+)
MASPVRLAEGLMYFEEYTEMARALDHLKNSPSVMNPKIGRGERSQITHFHTTLQRSLATLCRSPENKQRSELQRLYMWFSSYKQHLPVAFIDRLEMDTQDRWMFKSGSYSRNRVQTQNDSFAVDFLSATTVKPSSKGTSGDVQTTDIEKNEEMNSKERLRVVDVVASPPIDCSSSNINSDLNKTEEFNKLRETTSMINGTDYCTSLESTIDMNLTASSRLSRESLKKTQLNLTANEAQVVDKINMNAPPPRNRGFPTRNIQRRKSYSARQTRSQQESVSMRDPYSPNLHMRTVQIEMPQNAEPYNVHFRRSVPTAQSAFSSRYSWKHDGHFGATYVRSFKRPASAPPKLRAADSGLRGGKAVSRTEKIIRSPRRPKSAQPATQPSSATPKRPKSALVTRQEKENEFESKAVLSVSEQQEATIPKSREKIVRRRSSMKPKRKRTQDEDMLEHKLFARKVRLRLNRSGIKAKDIGFTLQQLVKFNKRKDEIRIVYHRFKLGSPHNHEHFQRAVEDLGHSLFLDEVSEAYTAVGMVVRLPEQEIDIDNYEFDEDLTEKAKKEGLTEDEFILLLCHFEPPCGVKLLQERLTQTSWMKPRVSGLDAFKFVEDENISLGKLQLGDDED